MKLKRINKNILLKTSTEKDQLHFITSVLSLGFTELQCSEDRFQGVRELGWLKNFNFIFTFSISFNN